MNVNKLSSIISACAFLGLSSVGYASSVTINFNNSPSQNTTAINNFATTGADMDGMRFTITYADGSSASATWTDTVSESGEATWGTNSSLSVSGDTFDSTWTLDADDDHGIKNILIDAGAGDTVFDTTLRNFPGTANSSTGKTFSVTSGGDSYDITATYSGAVGIGGASPVGDIFRWLLIDFDNAFTGKLTFVQDTDNLMKSDDINPVPVPAAVWLFASGLLGLMGMQRKKA